METTRPEETLPRPPGVIGSLRAGFDAVAAHAGVLLLPAALDAAIWLGPRVRIEQLVAPLLPAWSEMVVEPYTPAEVLGAYQHLTSAWNLTSLLRTFPVGLPSLMSWINFQQMTDPAANLAANTPLGAPAVLQAASAPDVLAWLIGFIVLGWLLGGLYYAWVARVSLGEGRGVLTGLGQVVMLGLYWLVILALLSVPALVGLSVLALINPALAQAAVFGLAVFAIWILLPVFFSPHGIFVHGRGALRSILDSFQMTRFSLSNSGMFLLAVIVLGQGFNMLWSVPKADTWLMLVGILGHAFITTALMAASFIYYRDTGVWAEKMRQYLKMRAASQQAKHI